MTPEMQKAMEGFRKWRDSHKNVMAVGQTVRGLAECEKDPKTALNKAQAQKVLAVLKSWRTKPTMSNDQAKEVNKQLNASLNVTQIKKIASIPAFGRGGQGGGRPGGGMGGPPGGGGPGGGRPGGGAPGGPGGGGFRMPSGPPKEFNPLNPDTIPMERMKQSAKQRLDDLNKALAAAK
jgi:hypothetical protein